MNLYVGNVSKDIDLAALTGIFSKFGTCRLNYFV
jgi:hypothetical protein